MLGLICYPDTQMADVPVSISHDSPVLPTKDYYKNNTEKAAFRKRLFLIYASGCMSVPVAFLLKLTLREQGIALGWEQGTKLSGMFGDSTVKDRKRLGSTHYCWVLKAICRRDVGVRVQKRSALLRFEIYFRAALEHRKEKPWFQHLELSAISATF